MGKPIRSSILYRTVMSFRARLSAIDVTSLNIFQWCKFLRHAGRCVMMLFVLVIVFGAAIATWTTALRPLLIGGGGKEGGDDDLLVWRRIGGAILSLVYSVSVIMTLWSYFATLTTSPGLVPPGWHPFGDTESSFRSHLTPPLRSNEHADRWREDSGFHERHARGCQADINVEEASKMAHGSGDDPLGSHRYHDEKSTVSMTSAWEESLHVMQRPRWCRKCNGWKPPRCHHCSMMGRCVLKMDHYCVWVANTIGLLNYKFFVLFLCWAWLGCIISASLLLKPSIAFFSGDEVAIARSVGAFLAFVFTAAFSLALTGFIIMHWSLIKKNQTTIEAYEKSPLRPWPYDRGSFKQNFKDVFGYKHLLWPIPRMPAIEKQRLLSESLDIIVPLPLNPDIENVTDTVAHRQTLKARWADDAAARNSDVSPSQPSQGPESKRYDVEYGVFNSLTDSDEDDFAVGISDSAAAFARAEAERLERAG